MTIYFTWDSGTAADNMIPTLKNRGIDCFYENMALKAIIGDQVVTLDYKHVDGNIYAIEAV